MDDAPTSDDEYRRVLARIPSNGGRPVYPTENPKPMRVLAETGNYDEMWRVVEDFMHEQITPGIRVQFEGYGLWEMHIGLAQCDIHLAQVPGHRFELRQIYRRGDAEDCAQFDQAAAQLLNELVRLKLIVAQQAEASEGSGQESAASEKSEPMATSTSTAAYVIRKKGEYWEIACKGRQSVYIKDSKGMNYISYLLRNPRKDIGVIELVHAFEEKQPSSMAGVDVDEDYIDEVDWGNSDNRLDARAKSEYREQVKELTEERDRATANGDNSAVEKAQKGIDAIMSQLRKDTGWRGRSRRFDTSIDKARSKVTQQISKARDKIREHDATLAAHLDSAITTGVRCTYNPDPAMSIICTT